MAVKDTWVEISMEKIRGESSVIAQRNCHAAHWQKDGGNQNGWNNGTGICIRSW